MIDSAIIAYAVQHDALRELQRSGVEQDDFVDEWRTVWRYLVRQRREHDRTPSTDVLLTRFPDIELPKVKKRDVPMILHDLKQRRRYMDFLSGIENVMQDTHSFENVDDSIQMLQAKLNSLAARNGKSTHLVDLFSEATRKHIEGVMEKAREGQGQGIPTGLAKFDQLAGGMQKQRMIVIIGRTGIGKSWLDLLFVANAVINGYQFILYPLEMTLSETAFRLYTIFTSQMFGADKALKNTDLNQGHVNPRRWAKFTSILENKFAGSLLVADVGSLSDPYTNEKIEAEVELHKPNGGFWIDYLTLMKTPPGAKDRKGYEAVSELSKGVKMIATRQDCVGGCSAQVNREGISTNALLPRLEHIAYGDSIGQDANQVFSINRKGKWLYYALVKNRNGPEIEKTRVRFNVNEGDIAEHEGPSDDND